MDDPPNDDTRPRLTSKDADVLCHILDHFDLHGEAPLLREIAAHFSFTRQAAHAHVSNLRRAGALRLDVREVLLTNTAREILSLDKRTGDS